MALRELYHRPLCPFSRMIRLALAEKGLGFELVEEKTWLRRPDFLALNPAGSVPVLVEESGPVIATESAIAEYLEEVYGGDEKPHVLLPAGDAAARAEVRRLMSWFNVKFNAEVTDYLLYEKVNKLQMGEGEPDMAAIRAGLHNIRYHLDYISYLMEERHWLAGPDLTYADLAAGAHLSCLDYIGVVPWTAFPEAKAWYARLKSRPSFRPLLADSVAGFRPSKDYANLDF